MESAISPSRPGDEPVADTAAFYRHVLETLNASTIPFLVGGAYALHRYTGVNRHTRDLDIFIRRRDLPAVSEALRQVGYETELPFPHWLAKVHANGVYIDLIFSSGNAVAEVDDAWFEHASDEEVLGLPMRICPAEEMIWSKAFIMERERFDGADILHLLRARGAQLDWQRLFRRFEPHWRILLVHLALFGFVYPAQRALVPAAIMDELIERLRRETHSAPPQHDICLGTLLSREQYLNDVGQDGLQDGRATPLGNMSERDIAIWTEAIPQPKPH
ncbi:nucleotidyltransferase [Noviherbaspirillum autotrophicum]|uniref:Nucleotidyltransferase family protein n=1 Tax=Noviherbaspirillum autotrophicum TaxID=709839 RepID=A0A0C2BJD0_9BURK|nr:nucleotidyltransferase [Noviherbaspirillum autotrophicum]KIF80109.1 hypothetical protein TSA66_03680 [Noviherbaspirillum autotrophicum]